MDASEKLHSVRARFTDDSVTLLNRESVKNLDLSAIFNAGDETVDIVHALPLAAEADIGASAAAASLGKHLGEGTRANKLAQFFDAIKMVGRKESTAPLAEHHIDDIVEFLANDFARRALDPDIPVSALVETFQIAVRLEVGRRTRGFAPSFYARHKKVILGSVGLLTTAGVFTGIGISLDEIADGQYDPEVLQREEDIEAGLYPATLDDPVTLPLRDNEHSILDEDEDEDEGVHEDNLEAEGLESPTTTTTVTTAATPPTSTVTTAATTTKATTAATTITTATTTRRPRPTTPTRTRTTSSTTTRGTRFTNIASSTSTTTRPPTTIPDACVRVEIKGEWVSRCVNDTASTTTASTLTNITSSITIATTATTLSTIASTISTTTARTTAGTTSTTTTKSTSTVPLLPIYDDDEVDDDVPPTVAAPSCSYNTHSAINVLTGRKPCLAAAPADIRIYRRASLEEQDTMFDKIFGSKRSCFYPKHKELVMVKNVKLFHGYDSWLYNCTAAHTTGLLGALTRAKGWCDSNGEDLTELDYFVMDACRSCFYASQYEPIIPEPTMSVNNNNNTSDDGKCGNSSSGSIVSLFGSCVCQSRRRGELKYVHMADANMCTFRERRYAAIVAAASEAEAEAERINATNEIIRPLDFTNRDEGDIAQEGPRILPICIRTLLPGLGTIATRPDSRACWETWPSRSWVAIREA